MAVHGDMVEPIWLFEPMSAEIYDALPENECKGIEVVDGMIRPHPGHLHQRMVTGALAGMIEAAGAPEWHASERLDLRLSDDPLLNRSPDILVYAAKSDPFARVPLTAVLATVEVVAPTSLRADRHEKPLEYAEAGIPYHWRVEILSPIPEVHTFRLDRASGTYRPTGLIHGADTGHLSFPVEIDLTDV